MGSILAYFTNDGSVGLYSKDDKDVYHSVFGAMTEAYDKFILPLNLKQLLENKSELKILDICYGIGYNSKCFLNYYLENFSQKKIKNVSKFTEHIYTIDTDNIFAKVLRKKRVLKNRYIDKIDTYNINDSDNYYFDKNFEHKNSSKFDNAKLDNTDISRIKINEYKDIEVLNKKIFDNLLHNVSINAIDTNDLLMKLSPLFKNKRDRFDFGFNKTGIESVDKLLSKKLKQQTTKYKCNKYVNYLIIKNLIDKFKEEYFSKDVIEILSKRENLRFFDKDFINFAKFYLKEGYKLSPYENKISFLHNIYYRYISKSYKNTLKVLENSKIQLKYTPDDARKLILSSFERYDIIFLDAFTPSKVPSLWTFEFIKKIYAHLSYDGIIVTYSNSACVRNAFLQNNFYVGKIYNENENKFTGTIASKNPKFIKYKLNDYDMGLINSKAGIMYHDNEDLSLSNSEIIENRNIDLENSSLPSSSSFIKNFKGDKNAI